MLTTKSKESFSKPSTNKKVLNKVVRDSRILRETTSEPWKFTVSGESYSEVDGKSFDAYSFSNQKCLSLDNLEHLLVYHLTGVAMMLLTEINIHGYDKTLEYLKSLTKDEYFSKSADSSKVQRSDLKARFKEKHLGTVQYHQSVVEWIESVLQQDQHKPLRTIQPPHSFESFGKLLSLLHAHLKLPLKVTATKEKARQPAVVYRDGRLPIKAIIAIHECDRLVSISYCIQSIKDRLLGYSEGLKAAKMTTINKLSSAISSSYVAVANKRGNRSPDLHAVLPEKEKVRMYAIQEKSVDLVDKKCTERYGKKKPIKKSILNQRLQATLELSKKQRDSIDAKPLKLIDCNRDQDRQDPLKATLHLTELAKTAGFTCGEEKTGFRNPLDKNMKSTINKYTQSSKKQPNISKVEPVAETLAEALALSSLRSTPTAGDKPEFLNVYGLASTKKDGYSLKDSIGNNLMSGLESLAKKWADNTDFILTCETKVSTPSPQHSPKKLETIPANNRLRIDYHNSKSQKGLYRPLSTNKKKPGTNRTSQEDNPFSNLIYDDAKKFTAHRGSLEPKLSPSREFSHDLNRKTLPQHLEKHPISLHSSSIGNWASAIKNNPNTNNTQPQL